MDKQYEETVKGIASQLAIELSKVTQDVKIAQRMFLELSGNKLGPEYKVIFENVWLGVLTSIQERWNKTCKGGDEATDITIKFLNERLKEAEKLVKG
jgi:hypothetical protein